MTHTRRHPPSNSSELAKLMVEKTSGAIEDRTEVSHNGKNAAAVMLGRRGGLKGGLARAASLTPEERKEIATRAAKARWEKKR